jgi:hypothetical protein
VDWGQGGTDSLRIYAANQQPKEGVEPLSREKPIEVAPAYKGLAAQVPPPVPPAGGEAKGPATRQHRAAVRSDDKTPFPPANLTVEESAVTRSSGSRPGAGALPRGDRGDRAMRTMAQVLRVLTNVSDVHELLDYVLARVLEVVPAERGVVMRLDPTRKSLYAEAVRSAVKGVDDQAARRQGISHTIARSSASGSRSWWTTRAWTPASRGPARSRTCRSARSCAPRCGWARRRPA